MTCFTLPICKFDDVERLFEALRLSNSYEFLEFARPTSQRVIHVGGIGIHPAGNLSEVWNDFCSESDDKEFEAILSSAAGKVVLISFGSAAPSIAMPQAMRDAFLETIRDMKVKCALYSQRAIECNLYLESGQGRFGHWRGIAESARSILAASTRVAQ